MQTLFDSSGGQQVFCDHLTTLLNNPSVVTIVVLACDENGWNKDWLDPLLKTATKPILGGIFPQILYKKAHYQRGSLCIGLPLPIEYCLLNDISDTTQNGKNETLLQASSESWQSESRGTLLVIVDGLSTRISALLDSLFDHFALDKNIFGGGAGSLSLMQQPCILTPEGVLADAALLINIPINSAIGVAHGWEAVSSSFKVTKSERNIIRSLDWRPALEVYAEVVGEHSGRQLDTLDFFATSKAYPFGIKKISNEMIVRDPISIDEDGGLICVGEVPEGSFVHILHGQADRLISAAAKARGTAETRSQEQFSRHLPVVILVNCISRALFLGSRMSDELAAVSLQDTSPMIGALTLGEIANSGRDYLEFYNKTCVVCLLEDSLN